MKIFVDENIPQQIVTRLRAESHTVEYVTRKVKDHIILEDAHTKQAILITYDRDFERLVFNEHRPTFGVLLIRISRVIPAKDRARILANVLRHRYREIQGAFTIVTESFIDIRRPLI